MDAKVTIIIYSAFSLAQNQFALRKIQGPISSFRKKSLCNA